MDTMLSDLGLLYQALMDSAADAIVVINNKGAILHFSKSAEQLFQRTSEECIDQNVNLLMPEPYKSAHDSYLGHYHRTGEEKIIGIGRDVKGVKKDGTVFPMHLSVGKAVIKAHTYYIGICHDLSEYKKNLTEKLQLESLQNALFDAAVDGIITINQKGLITSFNKAAEDMFGYYKEETLGNNVSMLMPSPHQGAHDSYLDNYVSTGEAQVIGTGRDVPGRRKDGSIFPMRLSIGEAQTDQGISFISVCHDLTDYQNALIDLTKAEQRYKSIVECQGQIICRLDQNFKITFVNPSFQDIFDCTEKQIIGLDFINFVQRNKQNVQSALQNVFDSLEKSQSKLKTTMRGKSGHLDTEWWFTKVPNEFGLNEIQGFGIDVSEKEVALKEAAFFKNHDVLTGLLKIEAFIAGLCEWMTNKRHAIFYVDLNHFGLINNRYGFDIGDQILLEIPHRLKSCVNRKTLLCRPNADEFIVATSVSDAIEANDIALNLLDCISKPYSAGRDDVRLSGRVGVAIYPDDAHKIDMVIRQAESVLAKAKSSSNNIAFYDSEFNSTLQRQLDVEQRLRVALENELLKVHLQAKVDLITTEIIGYEALLRWHDPVLGPVSPVEFIRVAEEMSLAKEIDRYVLKTVFMSIRRSLDNHKSVLPIAVNITSSHFNDVSLTDYILALSDELQVPLNYLDLEVTEGVLLEMNQNVENNLRSLRAEQVKVSIDDFGTGYSSLSYIRKLTVDALKIDKSFVDDVGDEVGQHLVSAVIAIANAVHLDVIAEGIETEEQRQILIKLGCRIGQGYLFAKPHYICDVLSIIPVSPLTSRQGI